MALGNHEFDFGVTTLSARERQAKFPLLAANIRRANGQHLTKPYVLTRAGGLQVGILGLGYPNTPLTTAKRNVEGVIFQRAIETAHQYVPALRKEGAELIIVLSHLGLGAEQQLAEKG